MTSVARIMLVQTAFGPVYEQMLDATRILHSRYCEQWNVDFRSTIEVRRGFHPWQASFNRIEILADLLAERWRGWFLYLDADAVIRQPEFDIRTFLGKREDVALIAAPAAPEAERWNINNGVFFLNLGDARGREIARQWHSLFHATVTDEMLLNMAAPWQAPPGLDYFPDDQHLLQVVLQRDASLLDGLLLESGGLINHGGGRFIRQYMRHLGAAEERLAAICASVAATV